MKEGSEPVENVEIEETTGLKTVDTFEELNLNGDLLRGIYGTTNAT